MYVGVRCLSSAVVIVVVFRRPWYGLKKKMDLVMHCMYRFLSVSSLYTYYSIPHFLCMYVKTMYTCTTTFDVTLGVGLGDFNVGLGVSLGEIRRCIRAEFRVTLGDTLLGSYPTNMDVQDQMTPTDQSTCIMSSSCTAASDFCFVSIIKR